MIIPEDKETVDEEVDESPEEQDSEGEGIVIPEEFQSKVHELLKDADKHHLAHLRDRVYQKEDELRKEETKSKKGPKGKGPTGTMEVDTAIEN